ncbi:hypothetical protein U2F10_00790 [Leptothoe sp. EHU-05/26/07-4]
MERPDLRNPKRAATPSIRGYCFQFLCTFERWLSLKEGELIWCEGNEDIDLMIAHNALVEEQVKDLAKRITDASNALTSTVLNFAQGFQHNHHHGYDSYFIFRTTAELGNLKNQKLENWLSGEALTPEDVSELITLIQSFASSQENISASEALAYICTNNLEKEFLESCSWAFSEMSYEEMKLELIKYVKDDSRCLNLDPELVVGVATLKIAEVSSQNNLIDRCLSRYDFDCLVNDLYLSKVATEYNQRGTVGERVAAVISRDELTAAVVMRFNCIDEVRHLIQEKIEQVLNHPRYSDDRNLNNVFRSEFFLDSLSKLDFDVYIAYGSVPSARRQQVKERWLARRTLKMSSFRDHNCTRIVVYESLKKILYPVTVPEDIISPSNDDDLLMLAHIISEWVLELVGEFNSSHELFSIHQKIRCVCKWDMHQFATQEDSIEKWFEFSS